MAPVSLATRSYPKRKRAPVSYCEANSSDESGTDESVDSVEDSVSRKKPKTASKAITTKPLPKRKIFPFESLPAEIRNTIYVHALTDLNGIFLVSKLKHYRRGVKRAVFSASNPAIYHFHWRRRRYAQPRAVSDADSDSALTTLPTLVPNLLALSHQIYSEAQPFLYRMNAFVLEDTTALHSFLATVGPRNSVLLADVTIKEWGYSKAHKALNHPAFTLLVNAVNLRRLHLDCRLHWRSNPKSVAMQIYRDGFHWLEAVGVAKGKFDAAVEIIELLPENLDGSNWYGAGPGRPAKPTHEEQMKLFRNELTKLLR